MERVLLLILIMLAGLMAIVLFVRWYAAVCYRLIVHGESEVLDEILRTGEVPARWRRRGIERIVLRMNGPVGRLMQRLLMRRYARRMKGMIRLALGNRRISPEEAREIAQELRETAQAWLACSSLGELIAE